MGGAKPGASSPGSAWTPFIKRLTRAEMVERRAKGLRYNCDELYSAGHRCKRLFCLRGEDPDEDWNRAASADPKISLHAITDVRSLHTKQLRVLVAGKPMLVLVDSRSTHNFISEVAAQQLRLPTTQQLGLQVSMAKFRGEGSQFRGL